MDVIFNRSGKHTGNNYWGQCILVWAFPVLFIISGLLLPSGDPVEFPQFVVFLPLMLCASVAMFVSARSSNVLRRTKIILGIIYTLFVVELVVWRMMAH